jgi:hypothetical protein
LGKCDITAPFYGWLLSHELPQATGVSVAKIMPERNPASGTIPKSLDFIIVMVDNFTERISENIHSKYYFSKISAISATFMTHFPFLRGNRGHLSQF